MFDLKAIRDDPAAFDRGWGRRGLAAQTARILELDQRRRAHLTDVQEAQARRNEASREVGKAKGRGENADALIAEVAALKERIASGEATALAVEQELDALLSQLPNLPADEVPDGPDETANVVVRAHGEPARLNVASPQHFEVGERLGLMDFESAAHLSGARFVVLKGQLARLERALSSFMLDLHTTEFGYAEMQVPLMVREEALYGTGQLPKFADDLFRTTAGHWLIPTAEVSLTNLVREQIVEEGTLPRRYTALTPCFRAEAGAAGRDTRGMIRQHQFYKVELVSVTTPDQSEAEHERMVACAEEVLKRLGLTWRVMLLSAGDMGFSARKTYDIEVWLPGQQAFREISSCSNCGDFQARRMAARFRPAEGKGTRFLHTLNGSGLAVGRTLVAVLENYVQADGSVTVPEVLRPYMGGLEHISPVGTE
ncbi:serine--tRNA ligase [Zavarzinia sp. CC-PAN008]|uniref:serine--tRNA ligase n=1 Tax=Zavarzinia sp. CC-PAN008 TaxID=3243332 RepID=UPI003F74871F